MQIVNHGSLEFDGVDDQVTVENVTGKDFTLSAWIKTSADSPNGLDAYLGSPIIWSDSGGPVGDFYLSLLGNRLAFYEGSFKNESIVDTADLADGKWHHVAVTRQARDEVVLYVDGVAKQRADTGSEQLRITLAVAGFSEDELDISVEDAAGRLVDGVRRR